MKTIKYPNKNTWSELLKRPTQTLNDIESTVNQIFEDVQRNGDIAIKKYTSLFDGADLQSNLVTTQEIEEASSKLSSELKSAINQAKSNIEVFHKAQKTERVSVETSVGITCWQEKRAIQKVGIYIPAGTAPLFSTVLMLAIPANIAGCKEVVLCSPPNKDGKIANEILYAAQLCGV
ncbi:histidinol dehydrogenase, partial [Winogradskyella sp.]